MIQATEILNASILIVDDQAANVLLLEKILHQSGYRNVQSTMAPQTVAGLHRSQDFDLILLPYQQHGFGSDGPYVMRRRWDYFVQHLLGLTPPKEYKMTPMTPPGRP